MSHGTDDGSPKLTQEDLEGFLEELWKDVLARSDISRDDDFFNLGGTSIDAVVVADKLSSHIGQRVSPGEMYFHATISQLACLAREMVLSR
ncbi:phosphopantetheine-binding protein [Streptomyces canus]|uniref:phosphopantetheine-binding protein n=1 Tax=Streptomyces canus TaxID=58343 RepID=UPI003681B279